MLDQSFSFANFRTIFEIENRKGGFTRDFFSAEYLGKSGEIERKRFEIDDYTPIEEDDPKLILLSIELEQLLEEKEQILENDLFGFSQQANEPSFGFTLQKFLDPTTEKVVYTVEKGQTSFFTMKQLQYNIYRSFRVKQSNRHQIVKQVKRILQDNFDKYIVRTDIKSFYESVPQNRLMEIIDGNQLLSPKSKKLIANLIYHYNDLTGQLGVAVHDRKGVPRGAGVSAYLAELYMRTIDDQIKQLPHLIYYGRYVDDIIAIFSPLKKTLPNSFLKKIEAIVKSQGLLLSPVVSGKNNKTFEVDAFASNAANSIEFLGYRFDLVGKKYAGIYLSNNKIEKYRTRLEVSFDVFLKDSKHDYKSAKRLLIHRLNYLTKNTNLLRPKKGVIGIYYSNSLLEHNSSCLDQLNKIMFDLIDIKLPIGAFPELNKRLRRFCFRKGFTQKLFFNMASKRTFGFKRGKNIPDMRSPYVRGLKPGINNFEKIVLAWKK